MVQVNQIKKEKPNYGEYKLFETYGFALYDCTVCLVPEDGEVIWINDDGYMSTIDTSKYKYSCYDGDVTIKEFLMVVGETHAADNITAVFKNKDDIKITFEYTVD